MYNTYPKYIIYLLIVIITVACGPVNRFTRLRKIPRKNTYNYCVDGLKSKKSILNKQVWVVYSDRVNNNTTLQPGGRLSFKKLEYLQPLLVIGKKKDYLKVIKYNEEIIKNNKLDDHKKAEYFGWIHKSKLILENQSITDIRSGFKNKAIIAFNDTSVTNHPNKYFENDSVKTFQTPQLQKTNIRVSLYEIVYVIKKATDKNKVLISKTPFVDAKNINNSIIGWVNAKMIKYIGQQLFAEKEKVKNAEILGLPTQPKSMLFNPVLFKPTDKNKILKSATLLPLIDRSENCIYNVNGNPISFGKKLKLQEELKRINLIFYIEPGEKTLEQLPALINAFQSMNSLFENPEDAFTYQFASIISSYNGSAYAGNIVDFTTNFNHLTENLVSLSRQNVLKSVPSQHSWKALKNCFELIDKQKSATNIIITIGEEGANAWSESATAEMAGKRNCRFLGFQMYSGDKNNYNNFVIQYVDLINSTAQLLSKVKREKMVFAEQIKSENKYTEATKNKYFLDYPDNSMTQGGIYFPEKKQILPPENLTLTLDSFLNKVKEDNIQLSESLDKAFASVGKQKDKFDSEYKNFFAPDKQVAVPQTFYNSFPTTYPMYFKYTSDSVNADSLKYWLLLSEKELKKPQNVIDLIAEIQIDTKLIEKWFKKIRKPQAKKICDCPSEFDNNKLVETDTTNSKAEFKYRSTQKARKKLYNTLKDEIYVCRFCKLKPSKLMLSDAHNHIFMTQNVNKELPGIRLKDLRRKRKLSDADFEKLINYYKSKKEVLNEEVNDKISFSSLEQNYYWINTEWMP